MLKLPTYFTFKKYYFMDVLNMLSRYVLETDFLSERISQMKSLMKQSGALATQQEEEFEDV